MVAKKRAYPPSQRLPEFFSVVALQYGRDSCQLPIFLGGEFVGVLFCFHWRVDTGAKATLSKRGDGEQERQVRRFSAFGIWLNHMPKPPQEVSIFYCYLCLQWHEVSGHRQIVRLPAKVGLWIIKAWWYGFGAVGKVIAVGIMIQWAILGFGLAYYLIPAFFGICSP